MSPIALRLAALQFFATPFSLERNLAVAARHAQAAAASAGARLLLLPALFNTGYVYAPRLAAAAEAEDGPTVAWLKAHSAGLGLLLGGTLLLRQGGRVYNTLVLAEPNGRLHQYRQRHPLLWEHGYFNAGRQPLIAETALGRLGLLAGWDAAHPSAWAAYAGQVDALLLASAAPRFHRAVLNFPGAHKAYLSQLLPALLRQRDALDGLFSARLAACVAALGVPVIHAAMAGRFVTQVPHPRLSLLAATWRRPRYWPLAWPAPQASLRASFYGASAIYNGLGQTLASVEDEEGLAVAAVDLGAGGRPAGPPPGVRLPVEVRVLDLMLRALGRAGG
ncbi:MAG: carbon-nitrogen hydrolase family protein [Anaerolineales bacterium]